MKRATKVWVLRLLTGMLVAFATSVLVVETIAVGSVRMMYREEITLLSQEGWTDRESATAKDDQQAVNDAINAKMLTKLINKLDAIPLVGLLMVTVVLCWASYSRIWSCIKHSMKRKKKTQQLQQKQLEEKAS